MSNSMLNFLRIVMAFSATGMSLLLPRMMETLDIGCTTVQPPKKSIEGTAGGWGFGKRFFRVDQLLRTTTRKIPTATRAPIRIPIRLMMAT